MQSTLRRLLNLPKTASTPTLHTSSLSLTLLLLLLLACFALIPDCTTQPQRLATFNIELYPHPNTSDSKVFAAIRDLNADAVAVQEITDPARFQAQARKHLGSSWRFVYATTTSELKPGVLYNAEAYTLISTRTYSSLVLYPGARPAFEVRLRPDDTPKPIPLRILNVHLKALPSGLPVRTLQYKALSKILTTLLPNTTDHVAIVGDFNSTEPQDRDLLEMLAERHDLVWATRSTPCTMFWKPQPSQCSTSSLDHILTSFRPTSNPKAEGPCSQVGCADRDTCPVFYDTVSDHCPVTLPLPLQK